MLDTLLETRAITERTITGSAVSLVAHGAIIAAAVFATRQVVTSPTATPAETLNYVLPPVQHPLPATEVPRPLENRPPRGFQIPLAPVEVPDVLPPIDFSKPVTDPRDYTGRNGVAGGTADGDSTIRTPLRDLNATLYDFQVEKPASLIPGIGTPVYPELLKSAGIEGKVRVAFVVDTTGRAEMATLTVMQSDNPLFTEAVRAALPRMRFLAAEVGGKKVKQFAQMPFVFSVK
jgi:protein TonB